MAPEPLGRRPSSIDAWARPDSSAPVQVENYDALTGEGLRTRGFAWTSAVDVLLLHQ